MAADSAAPPLAVVVGALPAIVNETRSGRGERVLSPIERSRVVVLRRPLLVQHQHIRGVR